MKKTDEEAWLGHIRYRKIMNLLAVTVKELQQEQEKNDERKKDNRKTDRRK